MIDSIHVLHVDDEPDLADLVATFLEREDDRIDVHSATSVDEGLAYVSETSVDCIVSDYDMPGRNGLEFLEVVRERYPNIPFILFTGKGSEEIASDAISAGVSDYLQKEGGTGQYTVLANRIRNLVEKYHTQIELVDREKRLKLFFEQSPLGVLEWDQNWNFVRTNETANDLLGYETNELLGRSWEVIIQEKDREELEEKLRSNLFQDTRGYLHSNNENVRKDGEIIECEWHNWSVTDDNDDVVAVYSVFQDITDRQERERRYHAIFNQTYQFTGLLEPDGTLIEANQTALDFGGIDREAVIGKKVWEAYWFQHSEETRERAQEAVEKAANGEFVRHELPVQGANGDEAIIDFSVRPVFDDEDEVVLLVPEGRDITDLIERERELRNAKAQLDNAIQAGDMGTWEWDVQENRLVTDRAFAETFGVDPDETREGVELERFIEGIHDDDRERVEAEIQAALDACGGYEIEYRVWDETDELRWVLARGHVECDSAGTPLKFPGVLLDITDRKERERTLEETSRRLDLALEGARAGVWEWNIDTDELYWSDQLLEVLGISPAEFDNTIDVFEDRLHPEDTDTVETAIERAIAAGEPYHAELRLRTTDDEYIWCDARGQFTEDESVMAGVLVDITERKERERELRERIKELRGIRRIVELIDSTEGDTHHLLDEIVTGLPNSFQYPDLTECRLVYGDVAVSTDRFRDTETTLEANTETTTGRPVRLEVGLLSGDSGESPVFIEQEADLIDTIVAFLREHLDSKEQFDNVRTARDRYETILSHLSDFVMIADENGEISYVSPAIEKVGGHTPAEVVGTNAFEYVHEADKEHVAEAFGRTISNPDRAITAEYRIEAADGSLRWVEGRGRNHLDEPFLNGILVALRDITERKEREQELIESRKRLELALAEGDAGIWEWDIDANELYWSDELLNLLGYSRSDFEETIEFLNGKLHPDDVDPTENAIAASLETGDPYRVEQRVETAGGTYRWLAVRGQVIEEDGDRRMVGIGVDITEEKAREQAVEELKARYAAYIEQSSDIITVLDRDGIIRYQSPSLEHILGYTPDEMLGKQAVNYMHPDDRDEVMNMYFELIDDPELVIENMTYRFKHADGSWVWLESSAANRESSAAGGYVINSRDVTERERREEQLRRKRDRLEQFASIVSHDLRNPLNVARGRLDLATADCDSEHLDAVDRSLDRMEVLIEDVLSLARQGMQVGDLEAVDLGELVTSCWRNVDTKAATLDGDCSETILADRSRVQQLVENVIRNAVEHGGEDVTVTVGEVEDGFFIEDDGPGIPEDTRGEVFEPGYSSKPSGTGFGLAIVKEITNAHDWEIVATESSGGGVRFEITDVEVVK